MGNVSLRRGTFGVCVLILSLSVVAAAARADVVLDWNAIAVKTAVDNKQNPFAQARTVAIVQLAVFEAVNSITGDYRPYLGITEPSSASAEAAAIEAAYKSLSNLFPDPATQATLLADRTSSLSSIPDCQSKIDGIQAGDDAAKVVTDLRAHDGSSPPLTKVPGPPVPGEWQATPSCQKNANGIQVGVAFNWQFITPFGISSATDYLLDPPAALTSNGYTKAYNEVMKVGDINSGARPQDRTNVALFFAATSPTQAFNQAARMVAEEKGGSLSENARALALMNMAISDGIVASFYNKYHYNFWRPETAIHAGDIDSNRRTEADPDFTPLVPTPCFPSYPSNHGAAGSAAAEVLRRIYGEAAHAMTLTNSAVPTIVLQYDSFREILDDISDARVYGGIHFRTDQKAGADLGRAVGAAVYKNNLRRVHDDD